MRDAGFPADRQAPKLRAADEAAIRTERQCFNDIGAAPDAFRQACLLRWKRFWAVCPRVGGQFAYGWVIWCVGGWYLMQWIGLAASLWRARTNLNMLILWLAIVSFLLLHTFYWTNTRMRAPLTGVIVVLAAWGWEHLFDRFIRGRLVC